MLGMAKEGNIFKPSLRFQYQSDRIRTSIYFSVYNIIKVTVFKYSLEWDMSHLLLLNGHPRIEALSKRKGSSICGSPVIWPYLWAIQNWILNYSKNWLLVRHISEYSRHFVRGWDPFLVCFDSKFVSSFAVLVTVYFVYRHH